MHSAALQRSRRPRQDPLEQILLSLVGGFILFFLVILVLITSFQIYYLGRIFPGVTVAGAEVGGMSVDKAGALVSNSFSYPQTGHILLDDQGKTYLVSPMQVGLLLDPLTTAQTAFNLGRHGNPISCMIDQLDTRMNGRSVSPALILDQRMALQYLDTLAGKIDQPLVEPSLSITGTTVTINAGQPGRTLNVAVTLQRLTAQLQNLRDGIVPIAIDETPATAVDVKGQTELAQHILAEPLTLSLPEGQEGVGPWIIDPPTLAGMLVFNHFQTGSGAEYKLNMDEHKIRAYLEVLDPKIRLDPENARFTFNDDTHQLELIQPAVVGRSMNTEKTIQTIMSKILAGEHNIPLELILSPPAVTSEATAQSLGISGLLHAESSYFYGSDAARVQNIQAAAKRFHGLLVAPGETFSMANALGDINLDNGYAEAMIISGGRTLKGVGGGVCQVSTTLFRTVFFSGLQIDQRFSHAYRVYYYEKVAGNRVDSNLAGLDATVFVPLVDFKFTNDTSHWLLMETYVYPGSSSITWKFYSTPDGRTVDWDTTGPVNIVKAPDPLYRENSDIPKGDVKQTDWSADGADVTVHRRVTLNGAMHLEDTFETHYEPWQAVYEYGPGTDGMPPPPPPKDGG